MADPSAGEYGAMRPQGYPLWCAEVHGEGDGISLGRVLGWVPTGLDDEQGSVVRPVLAFEDDDDQWAGTEPAGPVAVRSISTPVADSALFLGDSRKEVREAARCHALRKKGAAPPNRA